MKQLLIATLFSFILFGCNSTKKLSEVKSPDRYELTTKQDSLSYAAGVSMFQILLEQISDVALSEEALTQGVRDVLNEEPPKFEEREIQELVMELLKSSESRRGGQEAAPRSEDSHLSLEQNLQAGKAFLEANAKKDGVVVTTSGLQYKVLQAGSGVNPSPTNTVEVHYIGTLIDGTEFDNSRSRGETLSFPLNRVIPGWTEGVQLMNAGAIYRFFIPSDLAYGNKEMGQSLPAGSTLIFEVELFSIK